MNCPFCRGLILPRFGCQYAGAYLWNGERLVRICGNFKGLTEILPPSEK